MYSGPARRVLPGEVSRGLPVSSCAAGGGEWELCRDGCIDGKITRSLARRYPVTGGSAFLPVEELRAVKRKNPDEPGEKERKTKGIKRLVVGGVIS